MTGIWQSISTMSYFTALHGLQRELTIRDDVEIAPQ
jgi:hypothetical protein